MSSALERSFAASESGSITVHREMIAIKVVEASESRSITVHRQMIALKVVEAVWGANFEKNVKLHYLRFYFFLVKASKQTPTALLYSTDLPPWLGADFVCPLSLVCLTCVF